jgi:2-polyprenylphenol 6-hydroxylase
MASGMDFDVLIIGAGLSGSSLACVLGGSGLRVGLVERQAPALAEDWDARIYAISPANADFLRQCGVWDDLPRERRCPVERMQVHGDGGGELCFTAFESGLPALAWIIESGQMACRLWQRALGFDNVSILCPASLQQLDFLADGAQATLDDGRTLRAALVVAADGVDSRTRALAGLAAEVRPYGELGVVANFSCEKPHHGTAWQWFRRDGVLAWLPLPGNRISMVWSTPESQARALLALAPEALANEVADAGGRQLGQLSLLAPASGFPLRWMRAQSMVAPRLALIGDAAHAVHPLSGHGVNLGFQDALALAARLLALPSGGDCGALAGLQAYAAARSMETALVRGSTDGLQRLFREDRPLLGLVRNAGLSLAGSLPPLRSALARYAAGMFHV